MNRAPTAPIVMHRCSFIPLLLIAATAVAEPAKFSSGPAQARLIELFTSEGCSSCPPAEAWLGRLRAEPRLWRDFVPVAFHVDYWDRLGWPDPLARRQHTERQQAYAAAWRMDRVYTPEFVLDGREWRVRSGRAVPKAGADRGTLEAEVANGRVTVTWHPLDTADESGDVHVALLGSGFVSVVKAGENRGETLRHEFVALALKSYTLRAGRVEFALPAAEIEGGSRRALAVWVTRKDTLVPLQATGGWLD